MKILVTTHVRHVQLHKHSLAKKSDNPHRGLATLSSPLSCGRKECLELSNKLSKLMILVPHWRKWIGLQFIVSIRSYYSSFIVHYQYPINLITDYTSDCILVACLRFVSSYIDLW